MTRQDLHDVNLDESIIATTHINPCINIRVSSSCLKMSIVALFNDDAVFREAFQSYVTGANLVDDALVVLTPKLIERYGLNGSAFDNDKPAVCQRIIACLGEDAKLCIRAVKVFGKKKVASKEAKAQRHKGVLLLRKVDRIFFRLKAEVFIRPLEFLEEDNAEIDEKLLQMAKQVEEIDKDETLSAMGDDPQGIYTFILRMFSLFNNIYSESSSYWNYQW